jgi:hypothetical protein
MEEGAKLVCSYFEKKEPFLIGRNGSTELEVITYYMNNGPDTVFPEVLMNCLETYSGIFPPTQDSVRSWVIRYIDSLKECDVIWIRNNFIKHHIEYGLTPLSKKYNVSLATISNIVNNKVWKHL